MSRKLQQITKNESKGVAETGALGFTIEDFAIDFIVFAIWLANVPFDFRGFGQLVSTTGVAETGALG